MARQLVEVILGFGLFRRGELITVTDDFMANYGRYLVPVPAGGPIPMDAPTEEPVEEPSEEPVDGTSADLPSEG